MRFITLTLAIWAPAHRLELMKYRLHSAIKTGGTKIVGWTARAYVSVSKSVTVRNKLILAPVLCLLSFFNQLFFNFSFRLGQRLVLRLYRNNLRAEVDELRLHLQDYPIYLNLLRSLIDPLKELNGVAGRRQGGRNFGEGHSSSPANVCSQTRRGAAPELSVMHWIGLFFISWQN